MPISSSLTPCKYATKLEDCNNIDNSCSSLSNTTSPRSSPGRLNASTPPRNKTGRSTQSQTSHAYEYGEDWTGDLDNGDESILAYDEDEDEFGLPSLANMRRKGRRQRDVKVANVKATTVPNTSATEPKLTRSWSANTGDIAEERELPNYPSAKKSEGKILRPQYREILQDPANALHLINHLSISSHATAKEHEAHTTRISRINKFKRILQATSISLTELRDSAWSGIPAEVRAMTWQLMLGYLPPTSERRIATLERKRKDYLDGVKQAFANGTAGSEDSVVTGIAGAGAQPAAGRGRGRGLDEAIWHQISIDVPRTNPHIPLYSYEATQRSLERILYVWAIRHPASGYVQGINDLVTPFWQVFLGSYVTDSDVESGMDPGQLPKSVLDAVEADSFWCLSKLLDGIQDNYVFAQPGIQRQVAALRDLTTRIDSGLARHLESEGIEFIQFSFRWMNCLLMREFSVQSIIRMWDTYLVSAGC